jgi:hypothetical protein
MSRIARGPFPRIIAVAAVRPDRGREGAGGGEVVAVAALGGRGLCLDDRNEGSPRMKIDRSSLLLAGCLAWMAGPGLASAQTAEDTAKRGVAPDGISAKDLAGLHQPPVQGAHGGGPALFPFEFRTIDGSGNNGANPDWGSAGIPFLRLTTVDYENGTDSPAGQHRPSGREISNLVVAQPALIPNSAGASDFLWQWGQFIDHDLDLAPIADPAEPFDIDVPLGDPFFDPFATGTAKIFLDRSHYATPGGVRQQINVLSAFIDASMVYGSDEDRADALRTNDGTGRLKTSPGNLLPFNVDGLPNGPSPDPAFFVAGDVRVNEQVALTAMHTLFVREHNLWADLFSLLDPILNGDQKYELARGIVAAEIQAITYREFLPVLLGPGALPPYSGYKPGVNPGVSNVFATAAYRVGHTMLSPQLQRLRRNGQPIAAGHLPLADAFFRNDIFVASGMEPILRGLAKQPAQEIDSYIVDDVRNFLFGPPGAGGFDLASLNIQRGREHGLPSYNQVRIDFGLPPRASFAEVSSDPVIQANLAAAYATVDDVDIWVGGLAEDHVPGAVVGETLFVTLGDQFLRARDGDRFFYRSYMPEPFRSLVEQSTLARIIRRNTGVGFELQANAFRVP